MSHEQTASFKSERQKVELGPWAHATKERLEWPNQAKGGVPFPIDPAELRRLQFFLSFYHHWPLRLQESPH